MDYIRWAAAHADRPWFAIGGITLENVVEVAASGVDIISVGALAHSPQALDISLDFEIKNS